VQAGLLALKPLPGNIAVRAFRLHIGNDGPLSVVTSVFRKARVPPIRNDQQACALPQFFTRALGDSHVDIVGTR